MVDEAQAAHPGSIYRDGMRITYLGGIALADWSIPADGIYRAPGRSTSTGEQREQQ